MNKLLFLGAVLGFFSIVIGAYVDHSLAVKLSGHTLQSITTAIRYHQLYSAIIAMLGLLVPFQLNAMARGMVAIAGYLFVMGIMLFSFSIYISAITDHSGIMHVVPFGGVALMMGWLCLMISAILAKK